MTRRQNVATGTQSNDSLNQTKIIYYRNGDESYPRIEDLGKDDWNEYFFSEIYEKATTLISDIVNINILCKDNIDSESNHRNLDGIYSENINKTRNNIVAFIGERGSGKTSCLQTVYNGINKIDKLIKVPCVFNVNLPIIDPSYFNEHSNILEIVIAQMFQILKKSLQSPEKYLLNPDNNVLEKKRELVKYFQEVKETLDCINTPIKSSDTNDSVEALSKMASSNNLKQQMEKLIDAYLVYFHNSSNSVLIIAIDDLDVQTKHTYMMLEQIRKYLIINKVVILIGVKLKQLSDLVKQNYYNDFRELLSRRNVTINQIDDMASRYLLKLIPFSHRLMLPSLNDSYKVHINIDELDDSKNIAQLLLQLIYDRTRITFYNSLEYESLIIPHNFRELLNIYSFVLKLSPTNHIKDEAQRRMIITSNRMAFKEYFINSWCLDKLHTEHYIFIKELVECDIIQTNKFIIDSLYKWYHEYFKNTIIDLEIFNCHNRSYNISIADVQSVLDILSTNNDYKIKCLVFAIKLIYSTILYEKFYELMQDVKLSYNSEELIMRLNHTIKNNWQSNNKLNYLSDYHKLIGGNILHIHTKNNIGSAIKNKYLYIGNIEGKKLKELYKTIKSKKKKNKTIFNVFEFFLLSLLVENSHVDYRIFKHCYYDTFPLNDLSSLSVKFSFLAILANSIHFYRLYQLYRFIINKTPNAYDNLEFIQFFKLIEEYGKDSIIYNILYTGINESSDLKADIFRNKYLESFFLVNIEEIDIVANYLGHIAKQRNITLGMLNAQKEIQTISKLQEENYAKIKDLQDEDRYLMLNLANISSKSKSKENETSRDSEEYLRHQFYSEERENIKKEISKLKREIIKIVRTKINLRRSLVEEKEKCQKQDINDIILFFEKFSGFQYHIEYLDSLKDTNGYIKKFDFLNSLVNVFKNKNFVKEFSKIYYNDNYFD
ncbi:MAG: hypothetical protein IKA83_08910 [Paludibacteraceae bacterium]|nr:hypothetical protein [Paludibacteraceae bacterium]